MKKAFLISLLLVSVIASCTDVDSCYSVNSTIDSDEQTGLRYISNGDGTCGVSGSFLETENNDMACVVPSISPSGDTVISAIHFSGYVSSITLPDTISSMNSYCFEECVGLKNVYLSDGMTWLSDYAFANCSDLVSITIPATVEIIGNAAFQNCVSLREVKLPSSLIIIQLWAFQGCAELVKVDFPESLIEIGNKAFADCHVLTDVTFPSSLKFIDANAFSNCYEFKKIIFPGNVSRLSDYVLSGCRGLTSVILEDGVNTIRSGALWNTAITSIFIPSSVKYIAGELFEEKKTGVKVYCEAEEKPSGWSSDWDNGYDVIWGAKRTDVEGK